MPLLKELLSDWVGLLSLITILAVLLMAGYYAWLFSHKAGEEAQRKVVHATPRGRRQGR